MPTVEIIRFPGSDAFVADPGVVLKDALYLLLDTPGVISVHYGVQTEDGTTGYLIVVWETYVQSMNFQQHTSYFDLQSFLAPACANSPDVQHVDVETDVTPVLEAPTTEITALTPRPDVPPRYIIGKAMLLLEGLQKDATCHAMAWGESREKSGTWVQACGWDSMEVDHIDAVSTDEFLGLIRALEERAVIYDEHTNLVKYTR